MHTYRFCVAFSYMELDIIPLLGISIMRALKSASLSQYLNLRWLKDFKWHCYFKWHCPLYNDFRAIAWCDSRRLQIWALQRERFFQWCWWSIINLFNLFHKIIIYWCVILQKIWNLIGTNVDIYAIFIKY